MALFGAQGIRDSIRRAYDKHLRLFEVEPPEPGVSPHHASLHGALTLRYAASYRARPAGLIWLELTPMVGLEPEAGLRALAEYVVYRERPRLADQNLLRELLHEGLRALAPADLELFLSAAETYNFPWLRLVSETPA